MTLAGYSWVVTDFAIGMQTQVEVCNQILQHLETSINHCFCSHRTGWSSSHYGFVLLMCIVCIHIYIYI